CSGRCVDPNTDRGFCGASGACTGATAGTVCAAGQVCSGGTCRVSCPGTQVNCGGRCVDPTTDRNFCGASGACTGASAGATCAAGQVCMGGACVVSCPAGQVNCGGRCVDPASDPRNCGASGACTGAGAGTTCGASQVCSGGRCTLSCGAGLTACTGACVNTNNDPNFCGGCTTSCATRSNAARVCAAGTCAYVCSAGFGDCDLTATNGCEVTLGTDLTNCGRCGNACPPRANSTPTCATGACGFTCNPGFADCNTSRDDGCETNTNTSAAHCGACGRTCAGRCVSGSCLPVCNTGAPRVLFYGPTGTLEQPYLPAGSVVTNASDAMWRSMTTAQFAAFNLIITGDNNCSGPTSAQLQTMFDTRAVWTPAITGRVVITGLDGACHAPGNAGARTWLTTTLRYLSSGGGTALFITSDWGRRSLNHASGFGTFSSTSRDAEAVNLTVPTHPIFAGSNNTSMSNWGNSYHSFITTFPSSFTSVATITGAPTQHLVLVRDPACAAP
ncbi:MAG: hypothetical protein HY909_20275, partial [Deltaproteobacteria bacterium]|nr:hypothetical protein [Deltaproteobacteria bacterium]